MEASRLVRNLIMLLAVAAVTAGCFHGGLPPPGGQMGGHTPPVGTSFHYVLNAAAIICTVLAIASIVAHAWIPLPVSGTGGLIACAVGAWVLDYILVTYWWVIVLLAVVVALILVWHAYFGTRLKLDGGKGWLVKWLAKAETATGIDLDRSGTVGADPAQPPVPPAAGVTGAATGAAFGGMLGGLPQ